MDQSVQSMMFMMMSSMKNNESSYLLPFVLIILPFLSKPINDFISHILLQLKKKNSYIKITISTHEAPVVRSFSQISNTKLMYSKRFLSIVEFLHNIESDPESNILSLTEVITNNSELNTNYSENGENEYILMPINNNKILVDKNHKIYCDFLEIKNDDDEDNDKEKTTKIVKKNNFTIILYKEITMENDIKILRDFVKKCEVEYDLIMNTNKDDNTKYIFEYHHSEKSDNNMELIYKKWKNMNHKDIYKNVFLEDKDKEELINYIKPFVYNENDVINPEREEYERCGNTFKGGIILYGSPGCGKTSIIKAILNYTKRHGVKINLSKIKTCEELENIFRKRIINGLEFKDEQLCFILEDCDAMNNCFIKSRKAIEDEKKIFETNELNQIAKMITMKDNIVKLNDDDEVNLSCFLDVIDGVIELPGVMIIMTTNHIETIDEALIRPGRIGFKREVKKLTKKVIKDMIQFKFKLSDENIEKYTRNMNIKDYILSPAEIEAFCFRSSSANDCVNQIIRAAQKDN